MVFAEANYLIEDGEGIAHGAISLLGNDVQCFNLIINAFSFGNVLEVLNGVLNPYPVEVENLATRQDGGKNFMLLGGGHDENGMGWRFLECFQKGVESACGQHVHLINDVNAVFPNLGRYANLLNKLADTLYGVIGGSVEFVDVK